MAPRTPQWWEDDAATEHRDEFGPVEDNRVGDSRVDDQPVSQPGGVNGLGSASGISDRWVKVLSVEKVNESRERNIRALKSLLAFALFMSFAVLAVLAIINA